MSSGKSSHIDIGILFESARLNDMNVMCVRPFMRSMKERTDRIVDIRHVDVAQGSQRVGIRADRLQLRHRNLDVDDRLCVQSRHCRRAVVIDAAGELAERRREAISLRLECQSPTRIVRRDMQRLGRFLY